MLAAVFLTSLALLAPPKVAATFPTSATVGASWRASVSVLPPSRATLLARGPGILRAQLAPTKRRGRYTATLRFPAAGTWSISVTAGKRTTQLGRVVVDKLLEHHELGYKVIGFVDDKAGGDHIGYRGLPLLGTLAETSDILQRDRIDQLYVALPLDEHMKMVGLVESANREIVEVKVVPDLVQVIALRARLEELDGIPIININDVPLRGFNSVLKRVIDAGLSAAGLLVLSPVLGILALLIRLSSPGPAFFRQERMGLDGRSFWVWKFRSMYDEAERDTGPIWAREDDPRCTPVGRFLRRSNLDEIPQLWNVFCGDMSLVGPRPEEVAIVALYDERQRGRLAVKPGVTGPMQVYGRSDLTFEERLAMERDYLDNLSLLTDLAILLRTPRAIVRGDGAY